MYGLEEVGQMMLFVIKLTFMGYATLNIAIHKLATVQLKLFAICQLYSRWIFRVKNNVAVYGGHGRNHTAHIVYSLSQLVNLHK